MMIYIIDNNLYLYNSDSYLATANHLKKISNDNDKVKLLLKEYNTDLYESMRSLTINSNVINMYDYYQDITKLKYKNAQLYEHPILINNLDFDSQAIIQSTAELNNGGGAYDVVLHNQLIAKINVYPITFINQEFNRVKEVIYYDKYNHALKQDCYDFRGFLSSTMFFDENGNTIMIDYYNRKGDVKIEKYFNNGQLVNICLYENRQILSFNNEDEMFQHFLDNMVNKSIQNENVNVITFNHTMYNFISNINYQNTNYHVKRFCALDDIQYSYQENNSRKQNINAPLNAVTDELFKLPSNRINGVVVATHQQRDDLLHHFNNHPPIPIYNANYVVSSQVLDIHVAVPIKKRKRGTFVCMTSFLPNQSDLLTLISAVKIDKQSYTNIHVTIYVFDFGLSANYHVGDADFYEFVKNRVLSNGLEKEITFQDYLTNADSVMNSCQGYINIDNYDTQSFGTLLALEHGNLVIAHNENYGFDNFITNNYNGYLLPQHDQNLLAQAMLKAVSLSNDKWQTMVNNTYQKSKQYQQDIYQKQWQFIYNHK